MVGFMLFEVDASSGSVLGLGRHEMTVLPRLGDFVEVDDSGAAVYFEVIAVTLADRDDPTAAADVHTRRVGEFEKHLHAIRSRAGA